MPSLEADRRGRAKARPLSGPLADRLRALHDTLVVCYDGEGVWSLRQKVGERFNVLAKFNAMDSRIEDEARKIVWRANRGGFLADIEESERIAEEAARRANGDEERFRYWYDYLAETRHFGVNGFAGQRKSA